MTGLHLIRLELNNKSAESAGFETYESENEESSEESKSCKKRKRNDEHDENDGNGKKRAKTRRTAIKLSIRKAQESDQTIYFKDLQTTFGKCSSTISSDLKTLLESNEITENDYNSVKRSTIKRSPEEVEKAVRNKMSREELIKRFAFKNPSSMFEYFADYCDLPAEDIFYLREKTGMIGKPGETKALIAQFMKEVCKERERKPYQCKKELCRAFNDKKLLSRSITPQSFSHHIKKLREENALSEKVLTFFTQCDRSKSNKK